MPSANWLTKTKKGTEKKSSICWTIGPSMDWSVDLMVSQNKKIQKRRGAFVGLSMVQLVRKEEEDARRG